MWFSKMLLIVLVVHIELIMLRNRVEELGWGGRFSFLERDL
ncbi:Uncharacterised protein [Bartonella vinsonii]|uniref:Uncharacterized protein n=1 Tax=Bartonella vinsonii TaxID=33047 RepID=A0A448V3P0_BARVI|nr:Uncharacterised protein [Bartonella vinsonii]